MKFGTKAIHAGIEPDPSTGAIMTPIYQTSTYVQKAPGQHKGFEYARTQQPTRQVLEQSLAALENGKHGICFGSGMAAIDAVTKLFEPGDEVIVVNDVYGGTYRMFRQVYERYGIKFHFIDMEDISNIENFTNENTALVWIETPSNPVLKIADINGAAELAKKHNFKLCVDNTFASPYLQNPLDLGADIVVHSATKYLGGHSDVVLGGVVCNDQQIAEDLRFIQNSCGAIPGPQDCFLVLRGIKTLHLRMQQHSRNGRQIAEFLYEHSKVGKVLWPGLPNHPNHKIAKEQMRDFGGMISFSLQNDSQEAAQDLMSKTQIFALAESLGGVESLIGHPASMTHAAIPKKEREKSGVMDSLIRLSVGVEDGDDLVADLKQALEQI